jgi:hypothetical protein
MAIFNSYGYITATRVVELHPDAMAFWLGSMELGHAMLNPLIDYQGMLLPNINVGSLRMLRKAVFRTSIS